MGQELVRLGGLSLRAAAAATGVAKSTLGAAAVSPGSEG